MADTTIELNPFAKNDSRPVNTPPDNTMGKALDRVKSNATTMARTTAGKMMPGGNTMISVNSMKGEALRGRSDNLTSKKGFKQLRYARSAE